jgi:primosomal protein N' (replication factor Y) (superfamily II helicase)
MKFADVIIPLPLQDDYTYSIPDEIVESVQVGCRVLVPFGQRKSYIGVVRRLHGNPPTGYKVKPLLRLIDSAPVVLPRQLELWEWIAKYYICPLGDVYNAALPAGLKDNGFRPKTETLVRLSDTVDSSKLNIIVNFLKKTKKQQILFETFIEMSGCGRLPEPKPVVKSELMHMCAATNAAFKGLIDKHLLVQYEHEICRLNYGESVSPTLNPLNENQQQAEDEINGLFETKNVVLLHGVTSSGKTEIYIHEIKRMMAEGKQVLYLLPEIALTTQITERLHRVFGDSMGVYHSKFSDAERVEVYNKQLSDSPFQLILGVRSSIFLPFKNLGLVVVDEEHETSYKQQDPAPRYHARNCAIVLADQFNAKVLLGTATPSLETYCMAKADKYGYVRLSKRYMDMQLPDIELIDIKRLRFQKRMKGPFSSRLLDSIGESLANGEQVILFQNRRGYSNFIQCKTCGWVPRCEHCDVSLTYHKGHDQLVCHYCGKVYDLPSRCPNCEETNFVDVGIGTEKIESLVHKYFPDARTVRMDIDTAHTRAAYERIIQDFAQHKYDVLIGTQMITKGLDFDNVSVVGILDADTLLNIPDFRSHERAFHVLAQVAGRAGRKHRKGKVILQTRSIDSETIAFVASNDYESMYNMQMEERKLFHYPPYFRLINVYLRHRDSVRVDVLAADMARLLRQSFGERVLGPDKPPVSRVQSMFIRKLIIKIEKKSSVSKVRDILMAIQTQIMEQPSASGLQVYYDVDPM